VTRPTPAPTTPRPGSNASRTTIGGNGDVGPAPSSRGSRPGPTVTDHQIPLEVFDGVVRNIFSVALTLSAARRLTEGRAGARLENALDELDDLVRELRHTALAHIRVETPSRPGVGPTERSTFASRRSAPDLVEEAAHALTDVDGVLLRLWTDAVADTRHDPNARDRIVSAAQLVRLARAALTPTAVS
jgi:hypothetical protein